MLLDNEKLAKASVDVETCQKMASKNDDSLMSSFKRVMGFGSSSSNSQHVR